METRKIRSEKFTFLDGDAKLHNVDGPAIRYNNNDATYYFHGKLHRLDGPAVDWPSKNYYKFYINGIERSETEFYRIVQNLKSFL